MSNLDPADVAAHLPSRIERANTPLREIEQHLASYSGYVAWSGGRDSTAAVSLATRVKPDVPVVWFDSGLEYPENREYIHNLSSSLRWNLHIVETKVTALELLKASGSWSHDANYTDVRSTMHDTLITQPAREAHQLFGPGEISGLRMGESAARRMLLLPGAGHYTRTDGTSVYAPLWNWEYLDVRAYLKEQGLPENPVYEKLRSLGAPERAQRVGLVVDGNNVENGRFTYLKAGWPDLWVQLVKELPRLNEYR